MVANDIILTDDAADQLAAESAGHYDRMQVQLFKPAIRLADINPRSFKELSKEEFAGKMAVTAHRSIMSRRPQDL
jgi:DNA (cytosine-5)-methyltransferase 1